MSVWLGNMASLTIHKYSSIIQGLQHSFLHTSHPLLSIPKMKALSLCVRCGKFDNNSFFKLLENTKHWMLQHVSTSCTTHRENFLIWHNTSCSLFRLVDCLCSIQLLICTIRIAIINCELLRGRRTWVLTLFPFLHSSMNVPFTGRDTIKFASSKWVSPVVHTVRSKQQQYYYQSSSWGNMSHSMHISLWWSLAWESGIWKTQLPSDLDLSPRC